MGRFQIKLNLAILFLAIFIFTITNVSAVDTFEQGANITIKHPVRVNGAISNSVACNITIYSPINKSTLVDFQPMTKQTSFFNYTLISNFTNIKGEYTYDITCSDGALNNTEQFNFLVNKGGIEPNESRSQSLSRTTWIFFILGTITFIVAIYFKKLPVRLTFILFTIWFYLIGINTAFIAMQDEIINPSLESFFSFFLVISHYINWFIFALIGTIWLITFIVNTFTQFTEKKKKRYMAYE